MPSYLQQTLPCRASLIAADATAGRARTQAQKRIRKAATDFHGWPERGRRLTGNREWQELRRAGRAQPPPRRPNNNLAGLAPAGK